MEPEIVGKRIKTLMKKYNLSKKEFSEKLGINLDILNKKLEGKEEFYLSEMLKIKEIFHLDDKSCDELFYREMAQNV